MNLVSAVSSVQLKIAAVFSRQALYLLFLVFVFPVIWLMMEALTFIISELDRFEFTTELTLTVKLTVGKITTKRIATKKTHLMVISSPAQNELHSVRLTG